MVNFLLINVNYDTRFTVSLPLPYILAYLKSLGYGGDIVYDVRETPLSLHGLEMWIHKLEPAVIGFTAYQRNMERIRFLSHYVKTHHKNIHILLGGPQIIRMPSVALKELEDIDIICREEGEIVTAAIGECLKKNRPLSSVGGITIREDGRIIDTDFRLDLPEDLDHYPSPYLNDIIDLKGISTAPMLASRGCKSHCLFCITPSFSRAKIRHHSAKRVLDEMEYLADKGVQGFSFADPNFTASPEKTLEILRGKIDRGIKTPLWCETRADLVDKQMLKTLREAGASKIAFGLESASQEVLKGMGKGIDLKHLRQIVDIAQSLGLQVQLYSIYGLPGETVEQARQTLDFVRACKVPIETNSLAQQMQLYFGSIYERNPRKYGFKALPFYRPAYISIGDQYETESLTKKDIRKIRNLWALASEKTKQDAHNKEGSFEVLDVLLRNEEDLCDEEAFYEYGAIASCSLEEQGLLWRFINGYVNRLKPGKSRLNQLIHKLDIFKETDQGARAKSRLILDCYSEMDGIPFEGMRAGYWDITLGQSLFLPSFERNFIGVREGERVIFEFVFPKDYIPVEFRDKIVKVWAKVHKVLNPVKVKSVKELKSLNIRNHYPLFDLDRLQQENKFLHYLALKGIPEQDLVRTSVQFHFLMLIFYYAKLHKVKDIKRMAKLLMNDKNALKALGDVLLLAGRFPEAAYYYGKANSNQTSTMIGKARALLLGDEPQQALEILNSMPENTSLEFQEVLLDCLKVVQPRSKRIPSLDKSILDVKVKTALDSE